jgi:hypothetical protein
VGHGVDANNDLYCSAHCARAHGAHDVSDHAASTPHGRATAGGTR